MKIAKLSATKVHGYMPITIDFFPRLTFLTGLNGCGKTSALRILMALLTPNLEELVSVDFATAELSVSNGDDLIVITAKKDQDVIELGITTCDEVFAFSASELVRVAESKKRDESRYGPDDQLSANNVYRAIKLVATPMFLGLDRRFSASDNLFDDPIDVRHREMALRRQLEFTVHRSNQATGLFDVVYLVMGRMREILAEQENLDESLRRKVLTSAFEYRPTKPFEGDFPTRDDVNRYRERLNAIRVVADRLKLPVPELQAALEGFFTRMDVVVRSLEDSKLKQSSPRPSKKGAASHTRTATVPTQELIEWLMNKPQADRILEQLTLVDQYEKDRQQIRAPIDRFLSLINGFLVRSRKKLEVGPKGDLFVLLDWTPEPRPITALSSGERQLVVMLAHLTLNPNLDQSGVFIVDEPELSLHVDWQERFVDAVLKANPSVQLIMATHSPAIILDRVEACVALDGAA